MSSEKLRRLTLSELAGADHHGSKVFADDPAWVIQEFYEPPKMGAVRMAAQGRKGCEKFHQKRINVFNADGGQFDVFPFKVIMKRAKDPSNAVKLD